jgi:hypothetical protein
LVVWHRVSDEEALSLGVRVLGDDFAGSLAVGDLMRGVKPKEQVVKFNPVAGENLSAFIGVHRRPILICSADVKQARVSWPPMNADARRSENGLAGLNFAITSGT